MQNAKLSLGDIDKILFDRIESNGGFLTLANLPAPQTFSDMQKASKRVAQAINSDERILIVGDYDVDGVVSTTIMRDFFDDIGIKVESFIPNRFEHGYGLSMNILFALQDADLIITVDNGINANEVATWCKENGKTLIITDHHTPSNSLPEAFAIINPKKLECEFEYDDICGAQVAWYFLAGIKKEMGLDIDLKSYLGLVSIAIIADVMPLLHINRAMVIAGLKQIEILQRECFVALKRYLNNNKFNSTDIAFFIAPLLNSAGRMQDASLAFDFLRSSSEATANINLQKLIETNLQRKTVEQNTTDEAMTGIVNIDDSILVAIGEDWHEGVVGIVASRVMRVYNKPCIILCRGKDGMLKGSGRSLYNCDLYGSIFACSEYLEKFGGHRLAIGMAIKDENLNDFIDMLRDNCKTTGEKNDTDGIMGEISLGEITNDLVEIIDRYEPYGEANRMPIFESSGLDIKSSKTMGSNGEHIKYIFSQNDVTIEAIEFKYSEILTNDKTHQVSYTIGKNSFRGAETLQLHIKNKN